ncbi:MAG: hypothetical protein V2I34_09875 [Bacteroidales bacterium]|jgi:hypothetical protein|nr:hypothetical protein [Bacteroidales bacterium]
MSKFTCLLISIIITSLIQLNGQNENCRKLNVGVYFVELQENGVNLLNEKYGVRSKLEWAQFIDDKVLESLQGSCPEINFVSRLRHKSIDPDYMFIYRLTAMSIDTDIKIPADSISYIDPLTNWNVTDYIDPVYNSESGFWMISRLVVNTPCHPTLKWILRDELTKNLDLDQVINENLMGYYRMINVIDEHEAQKSAPAREPEMEISLEKDYLSPLDKETRQMELYVKVKDCHGRYVYYPSNMGQPVYYQKQTGRCEFRSSVKSWGSTDLGNFATVMINQNYQAVGEYHLKEGIDPGTETVTLKTCGISDKANISEQKILIIRGLEINVKPVRKEIYQEEQTDIVVSFHEIDPDGNKEPISGKELEIKINGLVNGEITPKSNYVTDSRGEVRLNYKAGDKDEKITVTASFQPEDYPDKAEGKGSVIIKPPEYDAAITITRTTRKEFLDEKHDSRTDRDGCTTQTDDIRRIDENVNATIYVQCKLSHSADMPIFNQTWEYYQPISVNISGFDLTHMETHQMNGSVSGSGCANGGYETTVTTNYIVKEPEIYEPLSAMWIVAIDNETNKAVKIVPGGYSIEYDREAMIETESRQWDKNGDTNEGNKETKTTENLNYGVGPVEDPVPDPTFKPGLAGIWDYLKEEVGDSLVNAIPDIPIPPPSSEEVPEINPDLLVNYGDRIKSFGGSGSKEINEPRENGYERETHTYRWQMTRRKLNK